jgi:ubiquinone/menaquinone biosynthesis C-methylase UbiE
MARKREDNGYHLLGRYYDDFLTAHRAWTDPIRQALLGETLANATVVCDLACGTGKTAIMLAQRGIRTYAVDISSTMCSLARRNAKKSKSSIRVMQADMRTFCLPEKVDAILCEYVALNHVNQKSDLKLVARAASRALNAGGQFYFDINNRTVFQHLWPRPYVAEKRNVVFIMRGGHDTERDKGWMMTECFVRDGHRWRRLRERNEQVCWTPEEIKQTLQEAGFDNVRGIDAAELRSAGMPAIPPGFITFYLARKATAATADPAEK